MSPELSEVIWSHLESFEIIWSHLSHEATKLVITKLPYTLISLITVEVGIDVEGVQKLQNQ